MSDTLSYLIESEVSARVKLLTAIAPTTYGVWLDGIGWLKNDTGRVFADTNINTARSAAMLYGSGATVMPVDESLQLLERVFLERQSKQIITWQSRIRRWIKYLWH